MTKLFKTFPLIVIIGYIIFKIMNNWENFNSIQLAGFAFAALIVLYLLFMVFGQKHIDFKDGLKIKKMDIKIEEETNNSISYLLNILYIISLILFLTFNYNTIILQVELPYLLNLSMGIAALSLILKTINNKKTAKAE